MKHTNHKGACPMKAGSMGGMEVKTIQSPLSVKAKPRKLGGR